MHQKQPPANMAVAAAVGFAGIALLSLDRGSLRDGSGGWALLACLTATLCFGVGANITKKYLGGVGPMATLSAHVDTKEVGAGHGGPFAQTDLSRW